MKRVSKNNIPQCGAKSLNHKKRKSSSKENYREKVNNYKFSNHFYENKVAETYTVIIIKGNNFSFVL